jgi:tRNA modification GTPase
LAELKSWRPLDALPFQAANGNALSAQPVGRIVFGRWGTGAAEEVVLCRTDDSSLEIHCHGGEAASRRILRDLFDAGCRVVSWLDAIRETESLLRAEMNSALSRATTLRTAAILWEQANGVFDSSLSALRSLASLDASAAAAQIREWLQWAEFGRRLTQPWQVVLAGRANVGKSSLINAILGYTRSVVFDQPGTTRDVVSAQTAIDGWPIELSDTAGLRESNDPLESAGVERASATLEAADLAIVLVDFSQPASQADRAILTPCPRSLVVAHKCDLLPYAATDRWSDSEAADWHRVSSKTGEGIEALVAAISQRLVPRLPAPDALVPFTERQVEILRRALEAADRVDKTSLARALGELVDGPDGPATNQAQSANRNGSPATS